MRPDDHKFGEDQFIELVYEIRKNVVFYRLSMFNELEFN